MSDEIKNPNTEDEEYQPDLMTLEDEDGNEVTFEVIDALDHKGVHYLAVVEYTENEEDAEDAQLVILSVGEDDEGEYLDVVEDDETLLEVSKLFEQRDRLHPQRRKHRYDDRQRRPAEPRQVMDG